MEILRVLPAGLRGQFLREYYAAAALAARQAGGYRQLHDVLRLWRLTAVAQSDPGLAERLAAVRAAVASGSLDGTVPAGEVLPGWPQLGCVTSFGSKAPRHLRHLPGSAEHLLAGKGAEALTTLWPEPS